MCVLRVLPNLRTSVCLIIFTWCDLATERSPLCVPRAGAGCADSWSHSWAGIELAYTCCGAKFEKSCIASKWTGLSCDPKWSCRCLPTFVYVHVEPSGKNHQHFRIRLSHAIVNFVMLRVSSSVLAKPFPEQAALYYHVHPDGVGAQARGVGVVQVQKQPAHRCVCVVDQAYELGTKVPRSRQPRCFAPVWAG